MTLVCYMEKKYFSFRNGLKLLFFSVLVDLFLFQTGVIFPIEYKKCRKCYRPKPPHAHHCSVCYRCVLRMDLTVVSYIISLCRIWFTLFYIIDWSCLFAYWTVALLSVFTNLSILSFQLKYQKTNIVRNTRGGGKKINSLLLLLQPMDLIKKHRFLNVLT